MLQSPHLLADRMVRACRSQVFLIEDSAHCFESAASRDQHADLVLTVHMDTRPRLLHRRWHVAIGRRPFGNPWAGRKLDHDPRDHAA
jgi:hypothetical protein